MKGKKIKTSTLIIIIIVIIIVILSIILAKSKDKGVEVTTAKVELSNIIESIPANGKIKPVTEIKISPDVSGEIVELNFMEGDKIKKGEMVLKIKQDVYLSLLDGATSRLNSSKAICEQNRAQLIQSELDFNRNKRLFEQGAIAEQEYEKSYAEHQIAIQRLKSSEYDVQTSGATLKEAKENLTKTTIYSPIDGTISRLNIEQGERVVGTSQMAGTEMLRIANLDRMEVIVDVNENDIIRINYRDTAEINIDAYPNRKFKGIVTHIANSSKNIDAAADQVTNFEVRIFILPESYSDLKNDNLIPLRPGMSASVYITTNIKRNIITVPIQAISSRTDLKLDGKEIIFVVGKDNIVEPVVVKTGIQDMYNIEITEGIELGSTIVVSPFNTINKTLKSGTLIVPQKEKDNK